MTAETDEEQFNNIFKDEAIALYSEQYNIPSAETCMFVVVGLMIAAAVIIIVYAPVITLFAEKLILGGFALTASGCAAKYASEQ
ncbi:hypothetical protein SAMN05446037_10645 [Anaerovirgula multivorans]|uniref:Uncharacterized protein n=1 Tax=Anaerovirgula multivorans TaxID=312168 RepID=A0A239L7T4_9FIRM|nr:hypothetical protein [Anaerovirgula multivorans]SNT25739.1 hypothetical protein SAMN05446037_10645 [Anaerovirgula multivorans]